jgi:hypothetical protein
VVNNWVSAVKDMMMGCTRKLDEKRRNMFRNLVWKPLEKKPLGEMNKESDEKIDVYVKEI